MWEDYRFFTQRYSKITLKSKDELIFRHIGFLIFRIHKVAFPEFIKRFGEDLLGDAILIAYKKADTYNLDYRDKKGNPNPVKFVSYIWKRIDGFIIDYLKKEIGLFKIYKEYYRNVTDECSSNVHHKEAGSYGH